MSRVSDCTPGVALFLAGIAAGALAISRRRAAPDPAAHADLKRSVTSLEARLAAQEAADAARFEQVETRLNEHAAKLAEVPSNAQIVAAIEQALSRTMTSLEQRLSAQADSIEALKTTVAETDSLLERVLESLDSRRAFGSLAADASAGETPSDAAGR